MMNKSVKTVLRFSILMLLLSGCSSQDSQPTIASSNTPLVSVTVIPTQTKQKPTQIPTVTVTPTVSPYPAKQVVLDYYLSGFPLPFDDLLGKNYSILVLYSDRQMIMTGKTFQQRILSEDEMHQFLSQVENLGFYTIESNQKHDPTDKLYDFGNSYQIEEMGLWYCVVTTQKPRELCAYDLYREFLVPEMKKTLYFLDRYKPGGMTLYYPDRILIKVKVGRNPDIHSLPEKALPWSENFPSLASLKNGTLYAEGKTASEIFSLLGGKLTPNVVTQNGEEYTIEYVRPVLPHEVVSFP